MNDNPAASGEQPDGDRCETCESDNPKVCCYGSRHNWLPPDHPGKAASLWPHYCCPDSFHTRAASAGEVGAERWTIKRRTFQPEAVDQVGVQGPDTDWIEVVPAAELDRLRGALERLTVASSAEVDAVDTYLRSALAGGMSTAHYRVARDEARGRLKDALDEARSALSTKPRGGSSDG